MGIDSMRVGGGRCPPLLVGGLLVACLMLICNWWTLSSENIELVRQIDELNEQLKISAEERDQCVTLRGNLEKRYKHTEKELESLHVLLEQQTDLKKKNDELEETSNTCKTKLDSLHTTLETLKSEKDKFNTQLDEKQDENKKLQDEIDQLKDELDKVKLTCTKPLEKNSDFTQQFEASPKQDNKDDKVQNKADAAEVEEQDNSKQENMGTTDGNVVESQRDQEMKGPTYGVNK